VEVSKRPGCPGIVFDIGYHQHLHSFAAGAPDLNFWIVFHSIDKQKQHQQNRLACKLSDLLNLVVQENVFSYDLHWAFSLTNTIYPEEHHWMTKSDEKQNTNLALSSITTSSNLLLCKAYSSTHLSAFVHYIHHGRINTTFITCGEQPIITSRSDG
jgi:hypothetical protein